MKKYVEKFKSKDKDKNDIEEHKKTINRLFCRLNENYLNATCFKSYQKNTLIFLYNLYTIQTHASKQNRRDSLSTNDYVVVLLLHYIVAYKVSYACINPCSQHVTPLHCQ